jgi:hypothetical protein
MKETQKMIDPPVVPARIARLPRDHRGFPVPWFVQWLKDGEPSACGEGEPDFRIMDAKRFALALRRPHCWICGELMGVHRVFTIGPMCAINRVISEPPSHRECAEFAIRTCPFLSRPRMRRNEYDLPADGRPAPGFHLDRNPGATCLWETPTYKPFRPHAGAEGILFRLGDPVRVDWYASGRRATRAEVVAAIDSGYPALEEIAREDGPEGIAALAAARTRVLSLLPRESAVTSS